MRVPFDHILVRILSLNKSSSAVGGLQVLINLKANSSANCGDCSCHAFHMTWLQRTIYIIKMVEAALSTFSWEFPPESTKTVLQFVWHLSLQSIG